MPIENQLIYLNSEEQKLMEALASIRSIRDTLTDKAVPQLSSLTTILAEKATFDTQLKAKDDIIILLQDEITDLRTK